MHKYKVLLINIGLFTLNTVSTKLITFLLVPLYTFFLTTIQYGITDMSLTVASLIAPIVTLSIGDAVTRYIIDDSTDKAHYISIGFWITLIGCLITFLLLPLLDLPIFGGLGNYKFLYFVYFLSSSFNAYLVNVARGLNHVALITWSSIISSLISASGAGILIGLLGWKIEGYFVSLILGGVVSICIYLAIGKAWRYISLPKISQDRELLKRLLLYSIPLMPNSIFWWIGTSVNRFFITTTLGIGASGLFAAASKIPNVMNIVSTTFWQAWSLSAFQEFKKESTAKFYSTVFSVFRTFCFIIASILILLSPLMASFLLQKEFYEGWSIIPILVLAFLFNVFAGFYGTVFTASMQTKYLLTSTVVAGIVVVVLTWLLLPLMGLPGAAYAMVVSNFVMYIMRVFRANRIVRVSVNWPLMTLNFILTIIQMLVMSWQPTGYMMISTGILTAICIVSLIDVYPAFKKVSSILFKRNRRNI